MDAITTNAMFVGGKTPACVEAYRRLQREEVPDLTRRQRLVLYFVYGGTYIGPRTVRDFARELKIVKPVVTRALVKLEDAGWLLRVRPNGKDRHMHVERTEEGERIFELLKTAYPDLNT